MLKRFSFKNYRAFQRGELQIKPITVLIGANSVGKTSALQLPLLLKQTAAIVDKSYKAALKVHGKEVSFGDISNIFYGREEGNIFTLIVEFEDPQLLETINTRLPDHIRLVVAQILEHLIYLITSVDRNQEIPKKARDFLNRNRPLFDRNFGGTEEFSEYLDTVVSLQKQLTPKDLQRASTPLTLGRSFRNRLVGEYGTMKSKLPINRSDLEHTFQFADSLSGIENSQFVAEFHLSVQADLDKRRYLRVKEFSIGVKSNKKTHIDPKVPRPKEKETRDILRVHQSENVIDSISSDFIDPKYFSSILGDLAQSISFDRSVFNIVDKKNVGSSKFLPEFMGALFSDFFSSFERQFENENITHIGPLRAHPKRFYFLDTAHSGSSESDLLVEALRENKELRDNVNKWLSKFGIELNVNDLQEIIYKLSITNFGTNIKVDITDVGFGISQILPILVEGFLSRPGKTIIVEQPEIHLHPKMQGDLADLFIDMTNTKKGNDSPHKFAIIETHSEYFLSRLRRRIADGTISHSDVAIHYVEKSPDETGSIIRGIYIPEDGNFEWPKDFFEDELDDAIAFLKSKSKKHSSSRAN